MFSSSTKSYIDVDAQEGIILHAGTTLAGSRTFDHPVFVDTSSPVPSRYRYVSFTYQWTSRVYIYFGVSMITITHTDALDCYMIQKAMPGNFNTGTDYACIIPQRGLSKAFSGAWDGVLIKPGKVVAIYRELLSAEQLLDGTIIYNVGSGDEKVSRGLVAPDDDDDEEWSIEAIPDWVHHIGSVLTGVSIVG